jgi:beta-glucosidase
MKKFFRILLISFASVIGLLLVIILVAALWITVSGNRSAKKNMALAGPEVKTLTLEGITFRDLNKNGKLDPYEDTRQPMEARVDDLISQMNLDEKVGMMFIPPISMKKDGAISEKPAINDLFSFASNGTSDLLFKRKMNHFNIFTGTGKKEMAIWYNNLQKLAERTRLGMPVTIASDPRNQYGTNPLASAFSGDFSLWPEPTGLAAIGDSQLTARFGDIARQEYLAVGVRVALHPMADLATEPRWGRINGTFGEDAALSAKLTYAYIRGFQGDSLGKNSVVCMTKHFSGGGPQKEGIDPHFPVAKGQIYPGNNFKYHLIPFEAAFKAGTTEIMPYYGVPMDQTGDNVGFSFNREMITGLLRNTYHFDGVVCTDWGILSDVKLLGFMILPARARGMENATPEERMLKAMDAGVDQFGGETLSAMMMKLVQEGKIRESRIDSSVKRLLRVKFRLGLFDDPFVNVDNAVKVVGNPGFMAEGELAQRKSIVLLKNTKMQSAHMLPLKPGLKIFIENLDAKKVAKYGTVVTDPEKADVAIIRLRAPSQPLKGAGILGRLFSSGDLDFKGKEKERILSLLKKAPAVVDIYLDRPAVIPEIAENAKALVANFGASDEAVLEVLFGKINPAAKLPFELPSSMDAVRYQKEDVPYDSKDPLFAFGFGLSY